MAIAANEIRARILNNQRAAHMEHWRNKARKLFPELSEEEIHLKARELERDKLVAAGRKGAETYRQRAARQRTFQAQLDDMIERAEQLLEMLRDAGRAA